METTLEDLPDEVLLIICQYLRQYHIIRAFFHLNNRLDHTISQFLQTLLVSVLFHKDKENGQTLLSIIGPYLNSLTIKHTHLSSSEISLASNIQELTLIYAQLDGIPPLDNLTDLNIIDGPTFNSIECLFSNNNSLHSVYIAASSPLTIPILSPPKFSTIKQLAVTLQTLDDYVHLLVICPELTYLSIILHNCNFTTTDETDKPSSTDIHSNLRVFSLRTISNINVSFDQLKTIFKSLSSQLEQLAIEIYTDDITCVDGELLEKYLQETFPELNRFEFFIIIRKEYENGIEPIRLATILQTFDSSYLSSIIPQKITGYYTLFYSGSPVCIHTEVMPTVRRRRYFMY